MDEITFAALWARVQKYVNGVALGQGVVQVPGPPGKGVPSGGTTGQVLRKKSDSDFDAEWGDIPRITNAEIQSIINKL
jgi:hypothetical protein